MEVEGLVNYIMPSQVNLYQVEAIQHLVKDVKTYLSKELSECTVDPRKFYVYQKNISGGRRKNKNAGRLLFLSQGYFLRRVH